MASGQGSPAVADLADWSAAGWKNLVDHLRPVVAPQQN